MMICSRIGSVLVILCFGLAVLALATDDADAATKVTVTKYGTSNRLICVSWTKTGDLLFTKYEVYVKPHSAASYGDPSVVYYDPNFNADSLGWYYPAGGGNAVFFTSYTSYDIFVRDVDQISSADSDPITVTTAYDQSIWSSVSSSAITIEWGNTHYYGSANGYQYYYYEYRLYKATSSSGPWSTVFNTFDESVRSYVDTAVGPGTTYYYKCGIFDHYSTAAG
jgi:hypothetical protein